MHFNFSGSVFWFGFTLLILVLELIILRSKLIRNRETGKGFITKPVHDLACLFALILIVFSNFQVNGEKTANTIRGFDNPTSTTDIPAQKKESVDVRGEFNKALDESKKEISK